jgi:hypothetical protein
MSVTRIHRELILLRENVLKFLMIILAIRIITIFFLIAGWGLSTLIIDYAILGAIYWYISDVKIIETILGFSFFTAIKSGDKEIEDELPRITKAVNGIILTAFTFIFIIPDTIGMLFTDEGMSPSLAFLAVVIGINCGILSAKLNWEATLFLRIIYAVNIAILIAQALAAINLGEGGIAQAVEVFLQDYKIIVGIIAFILAMWGFDAFFGTAEKEVHRFTKFFGWFCSLRNILKVLAGFAILYALASYFYPQAVVKVDALITNNQRCAEILRNGGKQEDCPTMTDKEDPDSITPRAIVKKLLKSSDDEDASPKKQSGAKQKVFAPVNGKFVSGDVMPKAVTAKGCDTLIAEVPFEPDQSTFANKPFLAKVQKGTYRVITTGQRNQWFFADNDNTPDYSRPLDANGTLLDASQGDQQWLTTGYNIPFPNRAYGGLLLKINQKTIFIGSDYSFKTSTPIELYLDINVYQYQGSYTSTNNAMKVKLFQCVK